MTALRNTRIAVRVSEADVARTPVGKPGRKPGRKPTRTTIVLRTRSVTPPADDISAKTTATKTQAKNADTTIGLETRQAMTGMTEMTNDVMSNKAAAVQMVPVEKIRVLNPRSRNKGRFREIVESISKVGLKKPITVSRQEGADTYDLVCGQGRLEAFVACGAKEIPAIVVDISLEERLLRSLVENLTRRTPSSMELARNLTSLKDDGRTHAEIAELVGCSESYVSQLIRLVENGEERLISAVERGDIPINAAIDIASTDDATMQKSLQDAYDSGALRGKSLQKVRKLIEERRARGKSMGKKGASGYKTTTTTDLVRVLRRETQRQELLIKKARLCDQQLRFVLSALKDLMKDTKFVSLLKAEELDKLPRYLNEALQK